MSALSAALVIARLAPELREAIVELVKVLGKGNEAAERTAYEVARRAAFAARQK